MSTYTNYYGLEKPAYDDVVDVAVINSNYDSIDSNLHRAEAVGSNIGFAYNPEITYDVGDYCLYNNTLYKCVQQVSVAEPFDSAKWSVTKITDDLGSGSEVVANPSGTASTTLTKLEVDGTIYGISGGGGGGSTVVVTPILQSGTAVADIEVDNVTSHLFAPTPTEVEANPSSAGTTTLTKLKVGSTTYNVSQGGGSTVIVNQTLSSGTEVAGISVDGVETKLYAPTPTTVVANPSGTASTDLNKVTIGSTNYNIPVGSTVVANPTGTSGTNLTRIKIDGTDYNISGGGGGSSTLAGLSDVDLTTPANGEALVYDSTNQEWINAEVGNTKYRELTQVQYDALSTAEKNNGTVYFITDASGGGGGGTSWDYSTTETDTGQKWVDGKSIYCKVMRYNYNCSLTNGSGGSTFTVDPPASNVETIVNAFAVDNGLYTTLIIKEISSSTIKINSSAPSITITSSTGYFCYFYTKSVS